MKICLISNLYEPYNRGGAERVVKDTINGLQNKSEEVFLITIAPFKNLSSLKPKLTKENGIKIYRFYPLNIFSYINIDKHNIFSRLLWHLADIFNCHSYFVIKKILQTEKPDIVHTHNLKGIGYLIPMVIKKLKIKHVHTIHDIQLASPSGLMIKGKENNWQQVGFPIKAYSFLCKRLFNSPQIIISPSNWLMDYYTQKVFFNKSQKIILRNPAKRNENPTASLESPEMDSNAGMKNSEEGGNYPKSSPNFIKFLFIGQVEYHKGILFLIDVFNSFSNDDALNINLDVIGDGKALKAAKSLAKGNISFLGRLSHQDTLKKLKRADLVIMPSLCYENSPNVVLEALGAGKPVVAADIGGAAELVESCNGYSFEAGNKEDLINKIKLAVKNFSSFNPNEIKKTIDNLGAENYVEKLISLYNR
ncbi:MAG: glycosyltransferase [bacterium]